MAYTRSQKAILREFGALVRIAREGHGWTQEDLAAEADLDRTYIGGIERGERNISLLNVNKLAVALGDSFPGFLPCRPSGRRR